MNELIYSFRDSKVRVLEVEGEAWFVAKDVCEVLEIKNVTQALQRLDEDERSMLNIGRQGYANVVNEYGLYSLILTSRKPEAKEFKRWITHEILPSIRKTGSYNQKKLTRQELAEALAMEVSKELDFVKQDVEQLKVQVNERMTIDYGEQQKLLNTKNKRVETLFKSTHNHIERSFLHRRSWSDFKKAFGVSSYRDTLTKDFEEAVKYLEAWRPLI